MSATLSERSNCEEIGARTRDRAAAGLRTTATPRSARLPTPTRCRAPLTTPHAQIALPSTRRDPSASAVPPHPAIHTDRARAFGSRPRDGPRVGDTRRAIPSAPLPCARAGFRARRCVGRQTIAYVRAGRKGPTAAP